MFDGVVTFKGGTISNTKAVSAHVVFACCICTPHVACSKCSRWAHHVTHDVACCNWHAVA
jgi:hypothetical protein